MGLACGFSLFSVGYALGRYRRSGESKANKENSKLRDLSEQAVSKENEEKKTEEAEKEVNAVENVAVEERHCQPASLPACQLASQPVKEEQRKTKKIEATEAKNFGIKKTIEIEAAGAYVTPVDRMCNDTKPNCPVHVQDILTVILQQHHYRFYSSSSPVRFRNLTLTLPNCAHCVWVPHYSTSTAAAVPAAPSGASLGSRSSNGLVINYPDPVTAYFPDLVDPTFLLHIGFDGAPSTPSDWPYNVGFRAGKSMLSYRCILVIEQ